MKVVCAIVLYICALFLSPAPSLDGTTFAHNTGLILRIYNNTALVPPVMQTRFLDGFNFSYPAKHPFSAEVTGTMTVKDSFSYQFQCDFGAATIGFLWIDDHMVCQTGAYTTAPKVSGTDNPLKRLSKAHLPVRLQVYYSPSSLQIATSVVTVGVSVSVTSSSLFSSAYPFVLSPQLSELEVKRRELQRSLTRGWGLWNHHTLLDLVQLPSGVKITTAICDLHTNECTHVAHPEDNSRVDILGYNFSYGQFFVSNTSNTNEPLNVSISFSGGDNLCMSFDLESGESERYVVAVYGGTLWYRSAEVHTQDNTLVLSPWGLPEVRIYGATSEPGNRALVDALSRRLLREGEAPPNFILPLRKNQIVGLSSQQYMSVADIASKLARKRTVELQRYEQYGKLAKVKAAVQAAVMWNLIYVPTEAGPLIPVSRGWDGHLCDVQPEWCYITFDWDNIFASYLLSLDNRDLAYSNFIQVIKSKTANGFIPNYAAATDKSQDRTEPPIGAKVLLELYLKYNDKWVVELLFDDLLDWNDWFMANRVLEPLNLISLGGSSMQNARFESGLDNSPMYDGDFYDANSSRMLLYDVGMSSLVAMEAEALSTLAKVISRPEAQLLSERSKTLRRRIADDLWDSESGIFVNKFVNESFYRRVSPTSFYPMIVGAASNDQVNEMLSRWFFNSTRFCISPHGDFVGNSDECYWGLPSISADDPDYLKGWVYWRGFVWGPMAQLVYWGLKRYNHVPLARQARTALCKQMTAMMLEQWNMNGHICENYSPRNGTSDCTGNRFYHWGGLSGFISLLEEG